MEANHHIEAIRDRHGERFAITYSANASPRSLGQCKCGKRWPCLDYVDAMAALAILQTPDPHPSTTRPGLAGTGTTSKGAPQ